MRKLKRKTNVSPPICNCGCGKPVEKARNGQYNEFLLGHNPKCSNTTDPSKNGNTGQFKTGNKYGSGRPQGSRNNVTIAAENIFENDSSTIARKAVDMALDGHAGMIKLVLVQRQL